jgi:hypothetical protein
VLRRSDAGRIAEEVIVHLAGIPGAQVRVTLEIDAALPGGTPYNVVRTVTENSRTRKFDSHGFEVGARGELGPVGCQGTSQPPGNGTRDRTANRPEGFGTLRIKLILQPIAQPGDLDFLPE